MLFHNFKNTFLQDVLTLKETGLRNLFTADSQRAQNHILTAADLNLDYSRQYINQALLQKAAHWLHHAGFKQKIAALFAGERINITENRAVSHPALRLPQPAQRVKAQQAKMFALSKAFHSGTIKGATGQAITCLLYTSPSPRDH
jgi:glucose-6-phosphate isomerase